MKLFSCTKKYIRGKTSEWETTWEDRNKYRIWYMGSVYHINSEYRVTRYCLEETTVIFGITFKSRNDCFVSLPAYEWRWKVEQTGKVFDTLQEALRSVVGINSDWKKI